jgi:hypothetical protein
MLGRLDLSACGGGIFGSSAQDPGIPPVTRSLAGGTDD